MGHWFVVFFFFQTVQARALRTKVPVTQIFREMVYLVNDQPVLVLSNGLDHVLLDLVAQAMNVDVSVCKMASGTNAQVRMTKLDSFSWLFCERHCTKNEKKRHFFHTKIREFFFCKTLVGHTADNIAAFDLRDNAIPLIINRRLAGVDNPTEYVTGSGCGDVLLKIRMSEFMKMAQSHNVIVAPVTADQTACCVEAATTAVTFEWPWEGSSK